MDPDALREALRRWNDEGVIDDATANRIHEFEGLDDDTERTRDGEPGETGTGDADGTGDGRTLRDRRVVVALALMGGALVAVGVGAFLLEWWDAIPVPGRVLLLLGVPLAAAAGGWRLGGASPRTAHGLWLLAALFAGVTLFQLAELSPYLTQNGAEPWLLLGWTTVAFAIATGLDSRPIGGLGALLGAATLLSAIEPGDPTALVGLYGSLVYAAGLFAGDRGDGDGGDGDPAAPRLAATLRWLGGGFAIVALALIATIGATAGPGAGRTTDAGTVVVGLAAAGTAAVAVGRARDRAARQAVAPAVAAPVGVAVAWALAAGIRVGDVPSALVALGCLLGLLIALVVAAVGLREAALVNVAALGFVLGVLSFLVGPIVDVVSGPLALVVAGLLLLGVGLGAERGRREILGRIR